MFEMVAGVFALGLAAQIVFWIVVALLFPVFWVWMLIDGALRDEAEYPSKDVSEKIVWLVAMFLIEPIALLYFFMVFRKVRRGVAAAPAGAAPSVPIAA